MHSQIGLNLRECAPPYIVPGMHVQAVKPLRSAARRPELDGLRGLAIVLVLAWHYGSYVAPATYLGAFVPEVIRLTWSGVDLFFVLSGFLLGGILIDNKGSDFYWRTFYLRRLCRIFPLYFAVLLSFLCFTKLASPGFVWLTNGALPVLPYFTFTQNIFMAIQNTFGANYVGPTWSLAVEEQFYLFVPVIVYLCSRRALPYVLAIMIGCSPLWRFLIFHYFSAHHALAVSLLTPCRSDELLLGVFCAWAIRRPALVEAVRRQKWLSIILLGVLCAGLFFIGNDNPSRAWRYLSPSWLAAFYAWLLVMSVVHENGLLNQLFLAKWLRSLGNISFGVYLLHIPVVGVVYGFFLGTPPRIATLADVMLLTVAFVTTTAIASLSWKLFERPIIALGHKLYYRDQRDVPVSAQTVNGGSLSAYGSNPP